MDIWRRRIWTRGLLYSKALRESIDPKPQDNSISGVAMHAAKHTSGRGSARTGYPSVPVAPMPDVGDAFHGLGGLS